MVVGRSSSSRGRGVCFAEILTTCPPSSYRPSLGRRSSARCFDRERSGGCCVWRVSFYHRNEGDKRG
ncbi:hypothetical protein Hanom_Chr04g00327711 [Helianthus anomalus]